MAQLGSEQPETHGNHPVHLIGAGSERRKRVTPLLEARQLTKVFPRAQSVVEVLRGCDFLLAEGESVAVTGLSVLDRSFSL